MTEKLAEHMASAVGIESLVGTDEMMTTLDVRISFQPRPSPLAPELRMTWRLAQFLYLLSACCRGGKSSLRRLHVINWGARTERNRKTLVRALQGTIQPHALLVRVEPSLNRVVDFASGEGLVVIPDGARVEITDRGRVLVKEVAALNDCLVAERTFVHEVGQRVSEQWVKYTLTYGGFL
jgi:hypothetical protein